MEHARTTSSAWAPSFSSFVGRATSPRAWWGYVPTFGSSMCCLARFIVARGLPQHEKHVEISRASVSVFESAETGMAGFPQKDMGTISRAARCHNGRVGEYQFLCSLSGGLCFCLWAHESNPKLTLGGTRSTRKPKAPNAVPSGLGRSLGDARLVGVQCFDESAWPNAQALGFWAPCRGLA